MSRTGASFCVWGNRFHLPGELVRLVPVSVFRRFADVPNAPALRWPLCDRTSSMVSLLVRLPASRRILRASTPVRAALCPSRAAKNPHTSRWVSVGSTRFCLGSGPSWSQAVGYFRFVTVCAAANWRAVVLAQDAESRRPVFGPLAGGGRFPPNASRGITMGLLRRCRISTLVCGGCVSGRRRRASSQRRSLIRGL